MSVFNEYFRAEVLSRALLSGPLGRGIAIFATAFWVMKSSILGIFSLIRGPLGRAIRTNSKVAGDAYRNLRAAAEEFGDRFEPEGQSGRRNPWLAARISGNGWRTGAFEFSFLCHVPTLAVRVFVRRSSPELAGEISIEEIAEILGKPEVGISVSDIRPLYSAIRRNHL